MRRIGTRGTRSPRSSVGAGAGAPRGPPPGPAGQRRAPGPLAIVVRVVTPRQVQAEVDERHRRAGREADDEDLGAEQPRRGDRLQQVLGDGGVDDRHGGDVEDDDLRAGSTMRLSSASFMSWVRAVSKACRRSAAPGCRPRPG